MSRFTLEKDDAGFRVSLYGASPVLAREEGAEAVTLRMEADGIAFVAQLSPAALKDLGLQCVALMPALAPQYSVASVEEAHRMSARLLKELDDRSIQLLLRECQSDVLIDFLWYMKDAGLIKLMLRNCSQRAAEMLLDDLDSTWRGKDPDDTLEVNARRGREAVLAIMTIVRRLIDEGQLPDILGEGA